MRLHRYRTPAEARSGKVANAINTPVQQAAVLAQLGVESRSLRIVEEGLHYATAARLDALLAHSPA
ncbi:MAG: hypothetical protein EOO77_22885 [Oxalobacteraceae bacterium]|nr:MAG: hypothetical protein EOO77_22885 [Oxalobacteraceae bacterium]